jgi:membrane-bound lytic murein transglycosylase A
MLKFVYLLPLLVFLNACSLFTKEDHFGSYPLTYDRLTGWHSENHAQALATFKVSCQTLARKSRERSAGSDIEVSRSVWQSLCSDAMSVPINNDVLAKQFFERRFAPYRITNNDNDRGLFTGYYVPVLNGSLKKHGRYIHPLYKRPADLRDKRAYFTHAEINRGALAKRRLELVWVDDAVMIFFLQIQGSGVVRLDNGKTMLVGYAGQNNRAYVSLGKVMGDEGVLPKDQINFFTIRQWLYNNPNQARSMMERNPSYVFFKELEQGGVVGAVGVELTTQRSIAIDSKYIPYGLPLFLETQLPTPSGSRPFNRIMIAQDTGGAIRGPVRGDIFFGQGADAEYMAGYMKGRGVYSLLVPKEIIGQMD